MSLRGRAAIVGVADAVSPTGELDAHGRALEARVIREALEDAGLTLTDVDGVCHGQSSVGLAEYLGIHPRFTESTNTGGSSYEVHVEHAAAAIAAGLCTDGAASSSDRPGRTRWSNGSCPTACGFRWGPTPWPPAGTWQSSGPHRSSSPRSR